MSEFDELKRSLTNQPPKGPEVVERFEQFREPAIAFAKAIVDLVPSGREKSLAKTNLEESVMWAIKGIALHQDKIIDE